MSSFGNALIKYRNRSKDPYSSKPLSYESLTNLLKKELGVSGFWFIGNESVRHWEFGDIKPPENHRQTLISLIKVLYQQGGIKTVQEADELLHAGDYRELNSGEIKKIFPINVARSFVPDEAQSAIKEIKRSSSGTTRLLKVFLCHASPDKPTVRALSKRLASDGVDVWLDEEKLLPGHNWREEIPKAVRNSDVVLVCLSARSVNKEGYVQKEIKLALDVADEKPEGTIFIIPARIEDCDVSDRLEMYNWVDLFDSNGYKRLVKALNARANQIGANPCKSSSE